MQLNDTFVADVDDIYVPRVGVDVGANFVQRLVDPVVEVVHAVILAQADSALGLADGRRLAAELVSQEVEDVPAILLAQHVFEGWHYVA